MGKYAMSTQTCHQVDELSSGIFVDNESERLMINITGLEPTASNFKSGQIHHGFYLQYQKKKKKKKMMMMMKMKKENKKNKKYSLLCQYIEGIFINMFCNPDNISPVIMRRIQNFLYFWSVTVTICGGDMKQHLKSVTMIGKYTSDLQANVVENNYRN
jgi:hypothetical protein